MDAKEYIDTLRRICSTDCFCDNCDFKKNGTCPLDKTFLLLTPSEDIVSSVEQWAKDHPIQHRKTRQDVVLAKFPNVKLDKDGIIDTCPNFPLYSSGTERCEQYKRNCDVCRRDYWLKEVDPNGRS